MCEKGEIKAIVTAGDAKPGQRILIHTGSCSGKTATVINMGNPQLETMLVHVDGREYDNLICRVNKVEIIH
jgi:hypothetical protein